MNSLSLTLKNLKKTIADCYIKVTDTTIIDRIKQKINNSINVNNQTINTKIQEGAFCNLPPKIGYFDEKTVPIYAHYNMSYSPISGRAWCVTSDADGQELIYFYGSDDGTKAVKVYVCIRNNLSDTKGFIFGNTALKPQCVNLEIVDIRGISNTYLIAKTTDNKWYRFDTNYSSNTNLWTATEITNMMTSAAGVSKVLWFPTVNRYLLLCMRNNKGYLSVYDNDLNFQWEDMVVDPSKAKYNNHPNYIINLSYYNDGNNACSGLCYVDQKNILIVHVGYRAYLYDENGVCFYANGSGGYVDHVSLNPEDLLTEHYFTSVSWNMGVDTWYNFEKSNVRGDSTFIFGLGWYKLAMSYDFINQYLYTSKIQHDLSNCEFWRVPIDKLDTTTKGANISFNNSTYWSINTPDTAPWAKQNNAPSIIYGNIYLYCLSTQYGWRSVAVVPEDTKDGDRKSVVAGSWKICDSNTDWAAGNDHYCCVREDFNKKDGASWYQLTADNTYIYVYRLDYKERIDSAGNKRDDYLYRPNDYVARFKRPANLSYWDYPKGIQFAYRSEKFGGTKKLIVLAQNNRETILNSDGSYTNKDGWSVPRFVIIEEDGSYHTIDMPQNYINYWLAKANKAYPQTRHTRASRAPFLDHDGQTFYVGCCIRWYVDAHVETAYKVKFSSDFQKIESMTDLPGQKNGEWYEGHESLGWCKQYGYTRTYSDRINAAIRYSQDSMDEAICGGGNSKTLYFGTEGSVGLIAYMQSTPIYLGGYFSVMPAQEIYLKPNSDNYIYLSRDKADYTKVNVEIYDHLLGVEDQSLNINFARILVSKITTDNKGSISQKYYNINYYGA